jgi:hypothetical protein
MGASDGNGARNEYASLGGLSWSRGEKAIARKAFERALRLELEEVMGKTRKMAERIKAPDDLWKLEAYLTHRRREIDREYQFRSGDLHLVLGELIHKGQASEQDLAGLREDKLEAIRRIVDWFKA